MEKIFCTCGREITPANIEFSNRTNEEGEDYHEVFITCDCGAEYETSQWGERDDVGEAMETVIEKAEEMKLITAPNNPG